MTAHYVYRCFRADGVLLYVGQTKDAPARLTQHYYRAFWAPVVAKVKVKVYPSAAVARAVERKTIRELSPRFNLQGRPPQNQWTRDNYTDLLLLFAQGNLNAPSPTWQWRRMQVLLADYLHAFGELHPEAKRLRPILEEFAEQARARREADELARARQDRERRAREADDRREHASHCCSCMYGIVVDDAVIEQFADEAGKQAWAEVSA